MLKQCGKAQTTGTEVVAGIAGGVAVAAIAAGTVIATAVIVGATIALTRNDDGYTVLASGDDALSNYAVWVKGAKHKKAEH